MTNTEAAEGAIIIRCRRLDTPRLIPPCFPLVQFHSINVYLC